VLSELVSLGVTAEALRAKIDRKLTISLQRGQFDPKFQVEGVAPPPIILAWIVETMNAFYNFVADSFHTKKLCSRLSSREVQFYTENGVFEQGQRTMIILGLGSLSISY